MHGLKNLANSLSRVRGNHPGITGVLLGVRLRQRVLASALACEPETKR